MANLLVRNIEEEVVNALKARSGRYGTSAEEEHRKILRSALLKPRRKSFSEALLAIPNVGEEKDFSRIQEDRINNVFD